MNTTSLTSYAQTAYRPGISCRDSIFAGLEAERKFVDEVDTVYTSFFDLDSAFDTVKFCVLLCELFNAGVKGKCWRLIQNWHSNITSKVKLGKPLSQSFSISISKGIRKGSVLSPTLFNLSVIDPLLKNLQEKSLGLSINSLFFGYFAHADDIRALASNIDDSKSQAAACCTSLQKHLGYFYIFRLSQLHQCDQGMLPNWKRFFSFISLRRPICLHSWQFYHKPCNQGTQGMQM